MQKLECQRVGWAIVGLGPLTLSQIVPAFRHTRLARPVALVSRERAYAARLGRRYGIRRDSVYDSRTFDRIAENPEIEAVYLVLPDGLQAAYALRAARARKHVLCETPMARGHEDLQEVVEECRRASVRFGIRVPPGRISLLPSGPRDPLAVEIDQFSRRVQTAAIITPSALGSAPNQSAAV